MRFQLRGAEQSAMSTMSARHAEEGNDAADQGGYSVMIN
jgi:hypothetical protein